MLYLLAAARLSMLFLCMFRCARVPLLEGMCIDAQASSRRLVFTCMCSATQASSPSISSRAQTLWPHREERGVKVRLEIGPKDAEQSQCTIARSQRRAGLVAYKRCGDVDSSLGDQVQAMLNMPDDKVPEGDYSKYEAKKQASRIASGCVHSAILRRFVLSSLPSVQLLCAQQCSWSVWYIVGLAAFTSRRWQVSLLAGMRWSQVMIKTRTNCPSIRQRSRVPRLQLIESKSNTARR